MRLLLTITLLVVWAGLEVETLAARPQTLAAVPTEELIGRFQQESKQTVGANTSMSVESFIGTDAPLRFGGGLLGVPLPKVSPVMRELVRRGVAAVPALLEHLSDARPTKLLISQNRVVVSMQLFNEEYDPRDFNAKELPAGVHRINAETARGDLFQEYRIRVGDLCYAALGQIVNRRLNAARYQQSGIVYVNSPVRTPALAAAARADWQGVTTAEFTAYLIRDLERNEDDWYNMSVLQRLLLYDPPAGAAQAVKLLNRGVYNHKPVSDLTTKLLAIANEQERERLLDDFWSTHEESACRAVEQAVVIDSTPLTQEDIEIYPEGATMQKRAAELAAHRFPAGNKTPSFSQLWLPCRAQCEVVETVAAERSAEVDAAVRDLFNRTLALRADDAEDKLDQCRLTALCAQRSVPTRRAKQIERACSTLNVKNPRALDAFLRALAAPAR